MFSDGITDQLGGEEQRALGKKRLVMLFEDHHDLSIEEQQTRLLEAFPDFQGDQLRRDDETIVGFGPSS